MLWIQSSDPLSWQDFRRSVPAWQLLGDGQRWRKLGPVAVARFTAVVVSGLAGRAELAAAAAGAAAAAARDDAAGRAGASGSCRRFSVTVIALVWTILIAALWPILMLTSFPGGCRSSLDASDFAKMVSAGFRSAAITYIVLESLRQVCRAQRSGRLRISTGRKACAPAPAPQPAVADGRDDSAGVHRRHAQRRRGRPVAEHAWRWGVPRNRCPGCVRSPPWWPPWFSCNVCCARKACCSVR